MFEIRSMSVHFGAVKAVQGVSMAIGPAESVGLAGPNGSGKSTLLNAISGIQDHTGTVCLGGKLRSGNVRDAQQAGVVRSFQTPKVFSNLTCAENVMVADPDRRAMSLSAGLATGRKHRALEYARLHRAREALELVGLSDTADRSAGSLPYGHQRLLEVARAIAAKPKLLLLDEPAAGLNDAETRNLSRILHGINRSGVAILVVEHKMSFLRELCERIVVLDLGSVIAEGNSKSVWKDPAVVAAYLGDAGA